MAGAYGMKGMVAPNAGGVGGGANPDIMGLIQKLFSGSRPGSPIDQVVRPFPQGQPQGPQVSSGVPPTADFIKQLIQKLFLNPMTNPSAGSPLDQVMRPGQNRGVPPLPGPPNVSGAPIPAGQGPQGGGGGGNIDIENALGDFINSMSGGQLTAPVAGGPVQRPTPQLAEQSGGDPLAKRAVPSPDDVQGGVPGTTNYGAPEDIISQLFDAGGQGLQAVAPSAAAALQSPQVDTPPVTRGVVGAAPDTKQAIADQAVASDSGVDTAVDDEGAGDQTGAADEADTAEASPDTTPPTQGATSRDVYDSPLLSQMNPSDTHPSGTGPNMDNEAIAKFIGMITGDQTGTPEDGSVTKGSRALPPVAGGPAMGAVTAQIRHVDVGTKEPSHQDPTQAYVQDLAVQTGRKAETPQPGETPDVVDEATSAGGPTGYGGRPIGGAGGGGTGEGRPNTTYTIKKGDSLYKIAQQTYGDPNRWREIARANKLNVKDPNRIYTGRTLVLPGPAGGPTPRRRPGNIGRGDQ